MGLIRAGWNAVNTTLADQWIEYFYCDSLSNEVLIQKGVLQNNNKGNSKASDNIITNGTGIAVNEGQAMLIVEDGKIVEFTVEAGCFIWDTSTEPSLFDSGWQGLKDSFRILGKRFIHAGETGKDQRIYYVNIKEVFDNKFGSATPMSYRDPTYRGIYIRYYGQYTFKIIDPLVFYVNVSGNINDTYHKDELMEQCDAEFITAFDSALSICSDQGYQYNDLPKKQREIATFMNSTLDEEWINRRGMQIISVAIAKVTPDDESRTRMQKIDDSVLLGDPRVGAGRLVDAQANAIEKAAGNEAGAFTGFLGMGMAVDAATKQSNTWMENRKPEINNPLFTNPNSTTAEEWMCSCNKRNTGNFCSECGKPKSRNEEPWTCSCGALNTGKFCSECGKEKVQYRFACSNLECKYTSNEPIKFCPHCGSPNKHK